MNKWKTLEGFEAQLLEDTAAKLRKAEPDYLLAREILAARLAASEDSTVPQHATPPNV